MRRCAALIVTLVCAAPAAASASALTSHNWAGYVAQGSFDGVSGAWNVPFAQAERSGDSSWIGIGGADAAPNLIQAGVASVRRRGGVRYEAWYELYPAPSVTLPLALSPGDLVRVSISRAASERWRISIADVTSGHSAEALEEYAPALSSVEWIAERPANASGPVAGDPFRFTVFSQATASVDGRVFTPAGIDARPISLINALGAIVITPSALMGDGSSFFVLPSAR